MIEGNLGDSESSVEAMMQTRVSGVGVGSQGGLPGGSEGQMMRSWPGKETEGKAPQVEEQHTQRQKFQSCYTAGYVWGRIRAEEKHNDQIMCDLECLTQGLDFIL